MPLYEYHCPKCGRFEVIRKFADEPLTTCPTCGSEIQKLASAPAIQFKGTGWYVTDYAKKSGGEGKSGKSEGGSDSKSDSKSDAKSETKSDAKSDKSSSSTDSVPAKGSDNKKP